MKNKTTSFKMKTSTEWWQRFFKKKRTSERITGRKMCRQIQQSLAKSLKKQGWKEKKDNGMRHGRTFPLFYATLNSKTCQTKWHHSLNMGGREGWERQKGETAQSKRTEEDKWAWRMWETETRETYNDNNEGDWQACGTVKTFGMSESKSKKQT